MKSIAIRLLCLQLWTALPGAVSALGQGCSSWMTPGYSSYSSLTASGSSFNSSVLVEGTTTGTIPLGCGGSSEIHHYPMVYNALGSVGGWYTGSQVPWNSYISYQNDQSTDDPEPGENYDYASTADVYCTVVGLFATFPFPDIDWGEAVTFTESTTALPVGGWCPQANACLNTTLPECPVTLVLPSSGSCFPYYETFVSLYRDIMPLGQL